MHFFVRYIHIYLTSDKHTVWTVLPSSSHCIIYSIEWAFFLCLGKLPYSKAGSTSNISSFKLSYLSNILENSFMWHFGWHHFLWIIFVLFARITVLIFVDNFASLSFLDCISWLNGGNISISRVNYFFYNSIYFIFESLPVLWLFLCLAELLSLLANFCFELSIFVKCHFGL